MTSPDFDHSSEPPIDIEALAAENLQTLTGYARDPSFYFTTIFLRKPEGRAGFELRGDCDEDNRAMLNRLYELVHADVESSSTKVEERPDGVTRVTIIPSPHNMVFTEVYTKRGHWEDFQVSVGRR